MPTNIDPQPFGGVARAVAIALAAPLLLAGCGGGGPSSSSPVDLRGTILEIGPNGGPVVTLDDATRAEIAQRPASGGTVLRVTLSQPDLATPAVASASEISAKVFTLSGEHAVRFSAEPGSAHLWNSPPGDFDDDMMQGELTVVIGGETLTRPFAFR